MRKQAKTAFLGACPMCKKRLQEDKLTVIDKQGGQALCCVTCISCGSSLMFTISSPEGGVVTTVGVLTDIQKEDIAMLTGKLPVTYEDVLDIHKELEGI